MSQLSLQQTLQNFFNENSAVKLILSAPVDKKASCKRITIRHIPKGFQLERQIGPQMFHDNLSFEDLKSLVFSSLPSIYRQLNAWSDTYELCIACAPDGSYKCKRKQNAPATTEFSHNRIKNHLLLEGNVIPPLIDMGIFTFDGKLVSSMSDKFKQINRFLEYIDDVIGDDYRDKTLHAIDFGCGKSYLTFVMYYYFTVLKGIDAHMTGLDLKKDVIEHCSQTARKYGYTNLSFAVGNINGYQTEAPVDMVVTLHACDTATDYALANAVNWNARSILSVPCCQHELNHQMRSEILPALCRYGIVQERAAALFTDTIRANLLTVCGYKTQILEFVDLSHTPKNLLIRAVKTTIPHEIRIRAWKETAEIINAFHLKPTLLELLKNHLSEFIAIP